MPWGYEEASTTQGSLFCGLPMLIKCHGNLGYKWASPICGHKNKAFRSPSEESDETLDLECFDICVLLEPQQFLPHCCICLLSIQYGLPKATDSKMLGRPYSLSPSWRSDRGGDLLGILGRPRVCVMLLRM